MGKKRKVCQYSKCPFEDKTFIPRFKSTEKTHFNYLCQKGYLDEFNSKQEIEKRYKGMKKERNADKKTVFDHLQSAVNLIARLIDYGQNCSSCNKKAGTYVMHGGHVRSVGGQKTIRYHLMNIWCQCSQCNTHKSGNGTEYLFNLKRLFGQELVDEIESLSQIPPLHMSKIEAKEKLKIARGIIDELKARGDMVYGPSARIELRRHINNTLGIYQNKQAA